MGSGPDRPGTPRGTAVLWDARMLPPHGDGEKVALDAVPHSPVLLGCPSSI